MYLVITLVVRDPLGILLVEVKAVLHQELHRLRFHDIILRAEQCQVVDLAQIRVLGLQEQSMQGHAGLPTTASCRRGNFMEHG